MKNALANFWQKYKVWIIVVVVVLGIVVGPYNGLVSKQESVNEQWANVETDYQRRFDLVPNLVNTVKGFAAHESDVFKSVAESRSAWQKAGSVSSKIVAAGQFEGALARLLAVVESYPALKSDANFLSLQTELAGTENRIAVSRKRFNESVKEYNTYRRRFPSNIAAVIFGFEAKTSFEMQNDEAAKGIKVEF